jgi:hypothetical protein
VGAAVDVNFVDAIHGKELEGIFDERRIGERQKTLNTMVSA